MFRGFVRAVINVNRAIDPERREQSRENKETFGSPVNKEERVEGGSYFLTEAFL